MAENTYVTGKIRQIQLKRGQDKLNQVNAAHCWRRVDRVIVENSNNSSQSVEIMGNVFCVQSVNLKHYYNEGNKYTSAYHPPELSRKNLKMTIYDFANMQDHDHLMPNPDKGKAYAINVMSLAFPVRARSACIKYDAENKIPPKNKTLAQFDWVMFAINKLVEADEREVSQHHKDMKAVVVANMYVLFQRMFDSKGNRLDFATLMLFPLKMLIKLFKVFHEQGPSIAFEPIKFEFTDEGVMIGTTRYMAYLQQRAQNHANNNNNNNNNTHVANGYVTNEDPSDVFESNEYMTSATGDDEGDIKFPPVKLHLTFDRASKFYAMQKKKNSADPTMPGEEDLRDPEENDFFGALGNLDVFKTSDKDLARGLNVNVVCPNGFEFVAVSSDFKKTKVNPLDMRRLSELDWIQLLLYDYIETRHADYKEFGVYAGNLDMLVSQVTSYEDTPLPLLTTKKMEDAIKHMMETEAESNSFTVSRRTKTFPHKSIVVFDKEARKFLTVADLAAHFEDAVTGTGFLTNGANRLVVGLGMYMGQEVVIHEKLKYFVETRKDDHVAYMMERIRSPADFDIYRTETIEYSEEQTKAIFMALMLPFLLIAAPGGRGKSEIMIRIFANLKKTDPDAKFVFTSFKNDTINQMREKMATVFPDIINDPNVFFRTNDSIKMHGGITGKVFNDNGEVTGTEMIDPTYIFVEEASMSSTSHIMALFACFDMSKLKKMLMFGDPDQLTPINPGCPFISFVRALSDATVRLVRNYRTDNAKFNVFLEEIRNKTFADFTLDSPSYFDGPVADNFDRGSNFIIHKNIEADNKVHFADRKVLLNVGFEIFKLLNALPQLRYQDIMAVTPYNVPATFVSWCFTHHFFEKPLMQQTREPQEETRQPRNIFDKLIENERKRFKMDKSPFFDIERAVDYSLYTNSKRENVSNEYDVRDHRHPNLYVGEDVCITKTDRKNKMIAQGRVAVITHIMDHAKGKRIDPILFVQSQPLPPDLIQLTSTAPELRQGMERTVVVDSNTVMTFGRMSHLHALLRSSKCCTVHQAQGRQGRVVFSIHLDGPLAKSDTFYTASSRAQSKCITITTPIVFSYMQAYRPEEPMSVQEDMLLQDLDLTNACKELSKAASDQFEVHTANVLIDNDDDDE